MVVQKSHTREKSAPANTVLKAVMKYCTTSNFNQFTDVELDDNGQGKPTYQNSLRGSTWGTLSMSADLLAEFGTPTPQKTPESAPRGGENAISNPNFGSFSGLSSFTVPSLSYSPDQSNTFIHGKPTDEPDEWGDFEAAEPIHQNSQPDEFRLQFQVPKKEDPNVLFDATEVEEDDFGDFEGSQPEPRAPPANSDKRVNPHHSASIPKGLNPAKVDSSQTNFPVNQGAEFGAVSRPPPTEGKADKDSSTKRPSTDSWDAFEDWEASIPSKTVGQKSVAKSPITSTIIRSNPDSNGSIPSWDSSSVGQDELPPTNVPPPGVLLSLVLPLLEEAQDKLFKPMAAHPLPMRNKLLAEPATLTFLRGYLAVATVAARIIAGRKFRWKRDIHLAQGMRIGPASSRGTSGMKLVGIEKGEMAKEEREVIDVVTAWKKQLGRLRHVVAAANSSNVGSLEQVPELHEALPTRSLKESEGGIPARQQCMLCGLRREERVDGIDQAVQDSFGEWWVEQVNMHRDCRNFWQEHKTRLQRSR